MRREGLGKEMEVTHTVVRWREQNMHGRIFVPGIEEKKSILQFSSRMSPIQRAIAAYTREKFLGESWLTSGKPNFEG